MLGSDSRPEALSENRISLSAVWLIYLREMRDQFRDRRTLFTILVLPVFLYPLLGSLMMQVTQFSRQPVVKIAVIGEEHLEGLPPLVELVDDAGTRAAVTVQSGGQLVNVGSGDYRFAKALIESPPPNRMTLFRMSEFGDSERLQEITRRWVRDGIYDVVVLIPPVAARQNGHQGGGNVDRGIWTSASAPEDGDSESGEEGGNLAGASVELVYNASVDTSKAAALFVSDVLRYWKDLWVAASLESLGVKVSVLDPFDVRISDLAEPETAKAAMWSKLLPLVMLVWAMTGAFYPAIDLVAGEKERGTLETILCSPALRSEIVWGKLAAVTSFSMLTAVLNTFSLLVTGAMIASQLKLDAVSSLPTLTVVWLLIALVPLSLLFSAVALGLSALARSSKEGQYYLMPMMLVVLPLVMLPTLPGITLSTGTGLIPVTGMFLLVRSLVEGQYALVLMHLPIVIGTTFVSVGLAVRWALSQFENESVLFHGGQPWGGGWLFESLRANRQRFATPTQAYIAAIVILVGLFFGKLAFAGIPSGFSGLAKMIVGPQILMILLPAVAIAYLCTRNARVGLRLRIPAWNVILLALITGIAAHPAYMLLAQWVMIAYPVNEAAFASLSPLTDQMAQTPWLTLVLLMAVLPAVCEELAFRGFIFGGLLRDGQPLRAILISSVVFGISHGVLQQSISATVMGMLLGWVSWRTSSVIPAMVIHVVNNSLSVSLPRLVASEGAWRDFVFDTASGGLSYQPMWSLLCATLLIATLFVFGSLRPDPAEQSPADQDPADADNEPVDGAVSARPVRLAASTH
jgi:sodium transport system permease protein